MPGFISEIPRVLTRLVDGAVIGTVGKQTPDYIEVPAPCSTVQSRVADRICDVNVYLPSLYQVPTHSAVPGFGRQMKRGRANRI